jgi:hypothetical protein
MVNKARDSGRVMKPFLIGADLSRILLDCLKVKVTVSWHDDEINVEILA